MKCAALEPKRLVERSCPPSTLSLLGLVRHLTEVEAWFHDFDGEPPGDWYSTEEDPDACFDAVDPSRADADLAATERASNVLDEQSKAGASMRSHRNQMTGDLSRCDGSICT
jgi:hypothetical protein